MSILIKDTTREERERIVAESFMEIRQVAVRITDKKFEIGDFKLVKIAKSSE